MRERKGSTPRRRGPVHTLTGDPYEYEPYHYKTKPFRVESPYYNMQDETDGIYGMSALPTQRYYIDPWDLENYDYVRKKLHSTPSPSTYYGTSLSPSPPREPYSYQTEQDYFDFSRNHNAHVDCCHPNPYKDHCEPLYEINRSNYGDYIMRGINNQDYNMYEDFAYRTHRSNSISDKDMDALMTNYDVYGRKSSKLNQQELEYYSNRYSILPYKGPACYECSAAHSIYNTSLLYEGGGRASVIYGSSQSSISLGPQCRSIYSGCSYANKFRLSKKGMLQIDYSCSWNDLDRAIGKNI